MRWTTLAAGLLLSCCLVHADETADELAAKATDPTASLMSFQLNDWYTASLHDVGGDANQLVFRLAIPFSLAAVNQIFRVTAPYDTSSPGGDSGLSDITIFDLAVFNQPWGAGASVFRERCRPAIAR